jgi:hypothetical protein
VDASSTQQVLAAPNPALINILATARIVTGILTGVSKIKNRL